MSYGQRKPRKPIYDPSSGEPPTETQMEKMRKQAGNVASYWLEQRPHSVEELRGKLLKKGLIPEIVEAKLSELQQLGYLDDALFLQLWISSYIDSVGVKKIERDLLKKGLDPDAVKDALAEVDTEVQSEAGRDLAARRAISSVRQYDPWKRKRSITQALVRRGFDMSDAMAWTEEAVLQHPADTPPEALNEDGEPETSEEKQAREEAAALKLAIQKLPGTRSKPEQKRIQSMLASLMRKGYSYSVSREAVTQALLQELD